MEDYLKCLEDALECRNQFDTKTENVLIYTTKKEEKDKWH